MTIELIAFALFIVSINCAWFVACKWSFKQGFKRGCEVGHKLAIVWSVEKMKANEKCNDDACNGCGSGDS